jgi:hypothetical protein
MVGGTLAEFAGRVFVLHDAGERLSRTSRLSASDRASTSCLPSTSHTGITKYSP